VYGARTGRARYLSIRVIVDQIKVLLHRLSIDVDDGARGNGLGSGDDLGPLSGLELVGDNGDRTTQTCWVRESGLLR